MTNRRFSSPAVGAWVPAWLCLLLIGALLALASSPSRAQGGGEADAARRAVDTWLQTLDSGRYAQTWTEAALLFQKNVPTDTWQKAVRDVREPLGPLQSRSETSAQASTSLPGVPDGNYLVLSYRSSFANQPVATETVAAVQEADGRWKVAGYFVR